MKYWGILLAKFLAGAAFMYGIMAAIYRFYPFPEYYIKNRRELFLHDLPWTLLMFAAFLLAECILLLIVWDQKLRCRTCGRRLRMPVSRGSHSHVLFGPPRTDYICVYGHGTLKVPELAITGRETPSWKQHDDIWKELYETSSRARSGEEPPEE